MTSIVTQGGPGGGGGGWGGSWFVVGEGGGGGDDSWGRGGAFVGLCCARGAGGGGWGGGGVRRWGVRIEATMVVVSGIAVFRRMSPSEWRTARMPDAAFPRIKAGRRSWSARSVRPISDTFGQATGTDCCPAQDRHCWASSAAWFAQRLGVQNQRTGKAVRYLRKATNSGHQAPSHLAAMAS